MRYFVCLLLPDARDISESTRRLYEAVPRSRGLEFAWHSFEHLAVLTAWDDPCGDAMITTDGNDVAVGVVRLDNREEVEPWSRLPSGGLSDLELVLRVVTQHGARCIGRILGDFVFLVWSGVARSAVAAGDALGIRKLYYAEQNGLVAFASRAEALAVDERYNVQYLAELIARCTPSPGLTPYEGVRRVPAGTVAAIKRSRVSLRQYWTPEDYDPQPFTVELEREAPAIFRGLLSQSVQVRLSRTGATWAQLSGGLDSSSIVSMVQWLAGRGELSQGLAGTVTYVDSQGTPADEREYSDVIAQHWQLRNEVIVDPPFWLDDKIPPPHLDQPGDELAFYPRECRMADTVRATGARVLLSGSGSDELLTGTTLFFADWVARGRLWATARELARWAAVGRVSFWQLGWGNALRPLVPWSLRRPRSVDEGRLLPWVSSSAARQYQLQQRTFSVTGSGRFSRKYQDAVLASVHAVMSQHSAGVVDDLLDVRHPFLSRPVVEFALRLPPELCVRPRARKWILREAMRGILPEKVRTRVGKGASTNVMVRSLTAQRPLLEPLFRNSILVELGVVEASKFRAAFDGALLRGVNGRDLGSDLQSTLMVEAWLQMRSGRWPQGPRCSGGKVEVAVR
jgi:asparagine synthase (glutamine-hydrolysing)